MPWGKKILLLIFLIVLVSTPVAARDYTLESAEIEVIVDSDGVVRVTESITYSFSGSYREVFRQVYPPPGVSIEVQHISCSPEPCQSRVDNIPGGYELVGVLPKPTPPRITFTMSYNYYRGLKVYDDVSELHYQLWGDQWEKPLGWMKATIHLPPGSTLNSQYWLNPSSFTRSDTIVGDKIIVETNSIPSQTWFELRAIIPRISNPNRDKVTIIEQPGLEEIKKIEQEHLKRQSKAEKLPFIVWTLAVMALIIPFYIYYQFGREPEIAYQGIYEREPPNDSKPAAVNAILTGKLGKPNINAFVATIMDLVYRGFINLKDVKTEKNYLGFFSRTKEDVVLELGNKEDREILDFELEVLNFLWAYSNNGLLIWSEFKDELGDDDKFYKFIRKWNKKIERKIKVDKLFISKGNYILMAFGVGAIIITLLGSVLLFSLYPANQFPSVGKTILPWAILFFVGLISLLISIFNAKSAGRFTPEGRLYYERWKKFRGYLTDFSALKEHPPESIKLWDFYMVYAVALGVAEKVIENMALIIPKEDFSSSQFYGIRTQPRFFSGFNRAYMASNPSSSSGSGFGGGVGGVGGGFGGGGGGAR
jgi:uncharacterized membrane protein